MLIAPFREQGTDPLYFSRSGDGDRYYVGSVPAASDSTTGDPPQHQVGWSLSALSMAGASAAVLDELERPAVMPFSSVPPPDGTWIAVVLHCERPRIAASIRSGNKIRTIRYRWFEKDVTVVPDEKWRENILGECKFQDTTPPMSAAEAFRAARKKQ